MKTLDQYIRDRQARQKAFDEGYDQGLGAFMLSQAIHLARKDAALTQKALAERTGLSTWVISKIERRIEHAAPAHIAAVCAILAPWLEAYGFRWQEPDPASPPARTKPPPHNRHSRPPFSHRPLTSPL